MLKTKGGLFLAGLTIFLFSAALIWSLDRLDVQRKVAREANRSGAWISSQAALEHLRLIGALDRYHHLDPAVDREALLLRLELFWSRVPLIASGPESENFRELPGVPELVADILATLERLEPRLAALQRGDAAAYQEIRDDLQRFTEPLHALMMTAMQRGVAEARYAPVDEAFRLAQMSYFGVMASGLVMILLLVRETRRRRALEAEFRCAAARAEEARQRLSNALESISEGFVLFDADERLVVCNTRYLEMFAGIGERLVEGAKLEDIILASGERGLVAAGVSDVDAWVRKRLDEFRNPAGPIEEQRADGMWLRREDRRTNDGGIVGIRSDITDLKRAEEAVRTRDAWLRAIFENASIEIVIKDTAGHMLAVSRNVAETFNLSVEDFIGRTAADFLPERLASIYMAADREVVDTGRPIQQEVVEELDGRTRHLLNAKFPLKDDSGRVVGVCNLTTDLTEAKAIEAQLFQAQKMEAVGQLTGGVAHDFNNLLAVILGNAELIADDLGDNDRRTQAILRASTRGAELTQRLLAFSRQQVLQPRTMDLAGLVGGMSELLGRTLGETIEVETAVESDLWAAHADPGQVENALLNLALNARDAMPNGGRLTIACSNARLDADYVALNPETVVGDYVLLAVSDSGTGMAPEVVAHAFEPFFTTKDVGQGSGLGLSMVYGFAKQSGGHVAVYSELGHGTTVRLYLPRAPQAPDAVATSDSIAEPRGRGEVVLVIEDDVDLRALAARMLEGLGYRVVKAPNGRDALRVLDRDDRVDIVLSDVILRGGMSGPEFARIANGRHPALKVMFMSGYASDAAMGDGLLGSDPVVLRKPFLRHELAATLREVLDA